jgi:hypothetical protein
MAGVVSCCALYLISRSVATEPRPALAADDAI